MNRITNYLTGAFLLLFVLSCTNDNYNENSKSISVNKLKQELHLDKFTNANIAENTEVDWKNANEAQKDNFRIIEVAATEKRASILESTFLEKHLNYQLITIESDAKSYSYFIEVYTNKGSSVYPETITKLDNFSGTFNVYLLNGENLGSVAVSNGKAINISEKNNLNVLTQSINAFSNKSNVTSKMPQCGGNYTAIIDQTISRFDVWTVAGEIVAINYVGTTTNRISTIMPYPCDGQYDKNDILNQRLEMYNYKNGAKGGSAVTILTDPSFSNNPCLMKVFNAAGGSLVFQNYLKKFDDSFSVANLRLTAGSISMIDNSIVLGKTLLPENSEVVIIMNDKELSRPALDIAKTLMHEMIHAEIFRQLLTLAKTNGAIDVNEVSRLAQLPNDNQVLEYYWKYKDGGKDAAHELMSAKYLEVMASFLKEVDKTLTQEQYEAIAWQGLMRTSLWNEKTIYEKIDIQYTFEKWKKESSKNCN